MEQWIAQRQIVLNLATTPFWFEKIQHQALQQWEQLPLPTIERVKYHRWPLSQTTLASYESLMDPLTVGLDELFDLEQSAGQFVQAGNNTLMESLSEESLDAGVVVMDLFEAMHEYSDIIQEHLFQLAMPLDNRVTAYHTAYLNGGVFIYIPKNTVLTKPIETLFVQDSRSSFAWNKHVLIIAEENSQIEYLERLQTLGTEANSGTYVVEIYAKQGANVKYMAVDTLGQPTHAYIKRIARTEQDAVVNWAIGVMNDGNVITDVEMCLKGKGSTSDVAIVGISNDRQIQAVDTKVTNSGEHTIGNILQHGVILDRGTLTFNGIGLIEKYAKYADAQQESRVLMLSDKARGDANPILLIEEYEVTAGHAASVGQVDEEQLYYLMSRGISRETAEYLMVRGFLGPVMKEMPSKRVRDELLKTIDTKLASFNVGSDINDNSVE